MFTLLCFLFNVFDNSINLFDICRHQIIVCVSAVNGQSSTVYCNVHKGLSKTIRSENLLIGF